LATRDDLDMTTIGADMPEQLCPGCDVSLSGAYCSSCGERRPADQHYSLREVAEEVVENVAHFDGTLLRTLRALFRTPGALTAAYMRGDRRRYMRPLQLFLLANVALFFLAGPLHFRAFDTPLAMHMHGSVYSRAATARVDARLAQRGTTLAAYAPRFDATATAQAKTLVIVMVPAFALLVALVNFGRRWYALQHVVFALHFYVAFWALFTIIALAAIAAARLAPGVGWLATDRVYSLAALVAMTAYLAAAQRRAYGTGRAGSVVRGGVLAAGALVILGAYRALLFFTAFYMS
jgi:hypothetical protein